MSASDALSALKAVYDVANKVKDNKDELLRVSRRIEHIVVTIEESRNRDIIRPDEYNDALTAITDLITRTQRVAQRLLKRNLGDRTWNTSEISSELRRLNDDVHNYLSVHTVRALDLIHSNSVEQHTVLANNVEEMMIKVAELDFYLRTRPGDGWAPSIKSPAETNFAKLMKQPKKSYVAQATPLSLSTPLRAPVEAARSENELLDDVNFETPKLSRKTPAEVTDLLSNPFTRGDTTSQSALAPWAAQSAKEKLDDVNFETLKQSGKITVKVTGLRSEHFNKKSLTAQLKADSSQDEIRHLINYAGFLPPDGLYEEQKLHISVTEGDSIYDAFVPGGLKVNRSEPLLWWWDKYTTYHGLAPATTPGHTVARLAHDRATKQMIGVDAAGVCFSFHRTLRVPDTGINNLPASFGNFPLVPVERFSRGIPPAFRDKGGFLMPMFRREAIRLEFGHSEMTSGEMGCAVKISVGGVNALSGISTNSIEPLKFGAEQDYIVVGQQVWLDGIVSGPGIIRQFVATGLGSGYTVEEQVTGKAEIGGFQFDVFPRRPSVDGKFFRYTGEELNSIYSPSELDLAEDELLILERPFKSANISWPANEWSLVDYKRRVSPSATIKAYYRTASGSEWSRILEPSGFLGLAAGGKIAQRIYRDKDSPRVHDEERGHRFYVHMVTPELWETTTGVLPPITPVTRDMYVLNGVNWYRMFDDYVDSITTTSEVLSNVLSVAQLDEINVGSSAESLSNNLIDPNAPPGCSRHPSMTSTCVFRPCNHLACELCLGSAILRGSKCPKCQVVVENFVGIQTPLSDLLRNEVSTSEEGHEAGEWSMKEAEKLAATAAGSDTAIIIHRLEDRPSPLYSSGQPMVGGR